MHGPIAINKTGFDSVSMETILLHNVAATTIATLGCVANIGTIVAIIKTRLHQEAAMLFVLNLIILNLIPCVSTLPYIAYLSFTDRDPHLTKKADTTFCRIMGYFTYSIVGTEIIGLILISVNRYILIVHFNKYEQIYKRRWNKILMLAVSWSIYPIILLLPVTEAWGQFKYDHTRFFCHPFNKDSFGTFIAIFCGSSLPVLAFCYIAMIKKVWKSRFMVNARPTIQRATVQTLTSYTRYKQDMHLIITVILILTTFSVLYTPFLVISIFPTRDPMIVVSSVYTGWTHCVINTLVYSLRNSHILKVYCCRNNHVSQ
ncbi:protein trapped in endoderm-1-like [Argopecten irradians]|uniref:protein trapped in endoderm-1-like n=1 Tax=Argopecten irradians TaxID=31199 RepID=UPI00371208F4